jgi:chromosomal replication initiation ATPase DnaA
LKEVRFSGTREIERISWIVSEAEEKTKQTLGWKGRVPDLPTLLSKVSKRERVEAQKVRGGDRRRSVVGARKVFCQLAVKRIGYSGAAVARFLGVTTSLVNRYASSEGVGILGRYL